MKRKLNLFIAIFLFLCWGGYAFGYEKFIHTKLTSTAVVLAKSDIQRGDLITPSDVYVQEFPSRLATSKMIRNKKLVIGKIAKGDISKNQVFTSDNTENSLLRPNSSYRFISVPKTWIANIPDSLRRLDQVDILAVPSSNSKKNGLATSTVPTLNDPVLKKITVAYVKSSKNTEVVGTSKPNRRLNGSNLPDEIELSMTYTEFDVLQKYHDQGYDFILTY